MFERLSRDEAWRVQLLAAQPPLSGSGDQQQFPARDDQAGRLVMDVTVPSEPASSVPLVVSSWSLRGEVPLDLLVLSQETLSAPDLPHETPLPTMIAQATRVAQPPLAMAFLSQPADVLAERDAGHALGLRGVILTGAAADEAAWERLLAAGLPLWALSTFVAGTGDVLSSLMYGNFICAQEEAALPIGWQEDREGIAWQDGPPFELLDRHGFVLHAGTGAGAWRDRGDEGLVRVRWRHPSGALAWSQPRLIAPRSGGLGSGCG
jgi:hypothetical protein